MNDLTNWEKIDKAIWDEFYGSSPEQLARAYVSYAFVDDKPWGRIEAIWELGLHQFIAHNERRIDRMHLFQKFVNQAHLEAKATA